MRLRNAVLLVLGGVVSVSSAIPSGKGDSSPAVVRSSPIALSPDGKLLAAVNPDSNSVSLIRTSSLEIEFQIAVGANPQTVAIDPSGQFLYVTNRDDDTLSVVNLAADELLTNLPTGDEPFGVVVGSDGRVFVSNTGSDTIRVIDQQTLASVASIPVDAEPRGMALSADGARLLVTHFSTGRVSVIDTTTPVVDTVISTGPDSNVSQGIWWDLLRQRAYLPHTRSNVTNQALLFDATVFPVVSVLDIGTGQHLAGHRIFLDIEDQPVSLPLDVALTATGKLYVLNAGSDDISVIDSAGGRGLAHILVGSNPRGLALSPDENRLFVNNTLSGSLSVIDTTTDLVIEEVAITEIPLSPNVLNGKILFNTSARKEIARDRWIACATCHFDATMDRRTWFFQDGRRNTPSLLGVGDTLPLHWSGDLDELQDTESTVRNIQAGTGLAAGPANCEPACDQAPPNAGRSRKLDDLAAYMRSLKPGRNPNLTADATLTESAQRGQALFLSAATGCSSCHIPPLYTDLAKHDVGTGLGPAEAKGPAFDTPSLRSVYQTSPYLHDGSAATLTDVLTGRNPEDGHGKTSDLTVEQLADLEEFLRSLPFESPPPAWAQVVSGPEIKATFLLANPSSVRRAAGTVSFADSEGSASAVGTETEFDDIPFDVPPTTAVFYDVIPGQGLVAGSALIQSSPRLDGTILLSGKAGLVAARATPATDSCIVPVESDSSRSIRSGFAFFNPNDSQVEVTLSLRDLQGQPSPAEDVSLVLPGGGRMARFAAEIFAGSAVDFSSFRGGLKIDSDSAIHVMAIRVEPGQMAALPVVAADGGSRDSHLAHLADGEGISSTFIVINPSATHTATGTVRLFDSRGEPLTIDIDGGVRHGSFDFSLPPGGVGLYGSSGQGNLKTGSAQIVSNLPVDGTLLLKGSLGSAGLRASSRISRALLPVLAGAMTQRRTGVAIANSISLPVEVALTLRHSSGAEVPDGSVVTSLPPHGQWAGFPEELFDGKNIDFSEFTGAVELRSPLPVSVTSLLLVPGELAVLPVTPLN